MSATIKYDFGQEVFWLSSDGFKKGTIKTVRFNSDKHETKTTYLLTCDDFLDIYMGNEVKEELIFTSYSDMLNYYDQLYKKQYS